LFLQAFEDKIKDLLSGAPPFASQPTPAPSGSAANVAPSGSSHQGLLISLLANFMCLFSFFVELQKILK
jgi:hypothetical protein